MIKQGKLTRSGGAEYTFELAAWVDPEDRYQRRYRPVTPASRLIQGSDDQIAPDETIAEWHVTDWSGGSGKKLWEEGRYNVGYGLHPGRLGGLVAAWYVAEAAVGLNVNPDAECISLAGETIYTAGGSEFNEWDWLNNDDWTTQGVSTFSGAYGVAIGTNLDVAWVSLGSSITKYVISTDTATASWDTGLTAANVIGYNGVVFALSKNELFTIDQSTSGSKLSVAGTSNSPNWDTSVGTVGTLRNRLATSDVGPIWAEDLGGGRLVMREYNAANDSESIIGTIPVSHGYVLGVGYSSGIYMALVTDTNVPLNRIGSVWLWLHTNGVGSVVGPLPNVATAAGTIPDSLPIIAGVIGNDVAIWYDDGVVVYDVATGGLHVAAVNFVAGGDITDPRGAVVFGRDIFVASHDGNQKVYRVQTDLYDATSTMTLTTGRYDFGYRGVDKLFADVTIQLADALDASDTLTLDYSIDSGTFTNVGSNMTSTDGTSKRWTLTNVVGKTLEWKLKLTLNTNANTPEILSITTRAMGAEYRPEWVMQIDISDEHSATKIMDLKNLALQHEVLTFDDPYQVDEAADPESFSVTIEELFLPPEQDDGDLVATIRLRATGTV